MPIKHAIWKVGNQPVKLTHTILESERLLEGKGLVIMRLYKKAAVHAVKIIQTTPSTEPLEAWMEAISKYTPSVESRKKGCPKSTFLSLCETGYIQGVPAGHYTNYTKNKA